MGDRQKAKKSVMRMKGSHQAVRDSVVRVCHKLSSEAFRDQGHSKSAVIKFS